MSIDKIKIVVDKKVLISSIEKISAFRWLFDKILCRELILCISNEILTKNQEKIEQKNYFRNSK